MNKGDKFRVVTEPRKRFIYVETRSIAGKPTVIAKDTRTLKARYFRPEEVVAV